MKTVGDRQQKMKIETTLTETILIFGGAFRAEIALHRNNISKTLANFIETFFRVSNFILLSSFFRVIYQR